MLATDLLRVCHQPAHSSITRTPCLSRHSRQPHRTPPIEHIVVLRERQQDARPVTKRILFLDRLDVNAERQRTEVR